MTDPTPVYGDPRGLRGLLRKLVGGTAQYRLGEEESARIRRDVRAADDEAHAADDDDAKP